MNMRVLALTLSLFCTFGHAVGEDQPEPQDQDIFKNLLKSEIGQSIYEPCKDKPSASALQECLTGQWNALVDQDPTRAQELAEELGTVEVTYDEKGNQVRKPTGAKIDNLNVNTLSETFTDNVDPAILALRTYLREQLSNALYGDLPEDKITKKKLVDHSTFYTLFESQVGQNIIVAVSDYCMSSNMHKYGTTAATPTPQPSGTPSSTSSNEANLFFAFEKEIENNKKLNLQAIQNDFSDAGSRDTRKKAFTQCVASISSICNTEKNFTGQPTSFSTDQSNQMPGAKRYACLVTDYLVQARQSLLKVSEIKKQIDENAKTSGQTVGFEELNQNKFYKDGQNKGEKSIRQLAIQTSTDMKNAGLEEAATKAEEKLNECAGGDETACKGFVSDDLEAKKELLANEFLKAKAQEQRLKSKLDEDSENAMNYLKEEGHTEEEATKIIEDLGEKETIQAINDRYQAQKKAVIESLAEKIDKNSAADPKDFASKTSTIKTELKQKADTLIKVMHFSNLASTYLELSVVGSTGQSSVNTVAAFSELSGESMSSGSKRTPSNEDGSSLYADNEDQLDKNLEALEELKSKDAEEGSGATFGVDVINNQILKY